MPSQDYRYYCLDSAGKLHDARSLRAENDEDAVAQVAAKHPGGKCEIWHDKRLVAMLKPGSVNEVITTSLRTLDNAQRLLRETSRLTADRYRLS